MALDKVGSYSLLAVNDWIGIINANLQGASRTAYKPTRAALTDGLGVNTVIDKLSLPPSTLTIQGTTVEWGQGNIINTGINTDFAIQGEGFFVVSDGVNLYATRDGNFHWGTDGYLYNSAGLKVLSNGQDFIRYANEDKDDIFNADGESEFLTKYGDKSLLIIDVGNRDGLKMSKYGATTFELGGNLPFRLYNDFTKTTDGVTFVYDDPAFIGAVDDPNFSRPPFQPLANAAPGPGVILPGDPAWNATDFTIDFGSNGVFRWSATATADATRLQYQANTPPALNSNPNGATITPGNYGLDIDRVSIVQLINEINSFNPNVTATWDPNGDRVVIINNVGAGNDDRIVFGGPNGYAVRSFLRLGNPVGPTGAGVTVLESSRDIDNSHIRFTADILPGLTPVDTNGDPHPGDLDPIARALTPPSASYTHDKATGRIIVDARGEERGGRLIVGEAQQTAAFEMAFDFGVSNNVGPFSGFPGAMVIGFGQKDAHDINSGGFDLVYIPTTGFLQLRQKSDVNTPPINLGPSQTLPVINTPVAGNPPAPPSGHHMAITLTEDGVLTISLQRSDGVSAVRTFNISNLGQDAGGYLSINNFLNVLQLDNLYANYKQKYNADLTGGIQVNSPTNYAAMDIRRRAQDRPRVRIIQAAEEQSTASLTEYVPMLSLAQKVFSSISKIISVHNATVDDLNGLIR